MRFFKSRRGNLLLFLALLAPAGLLMPPSPDRRPAWAGPGHYRLLVKVEPYDTDGRDQDEGVAEFVLDWPTLLGEGNAQRTPDLGSLQIMQYDPDSGKPIAYGNYAYAKSLFDRPFRWYDGSIPYEFPEFLGYASEH